MVWVVEINNPKQFYPELFTNFPSNEVFCFLIDHSFCPAAKFIGLDLNFFIFL